MGQMTTEHVRPTKPGRRRRWLTGAAVLVVAAVTVTLAMTWWLPAYRLSAAREAWQPPPGAGLSEAMREKPVPGWRISVTDLGLPRTAESRLAVGNQRIDPNPFVGSVDERAYFLADSGAGDERQWWLAGVDVHSGRPLFSAVSLGSDAHIPECFLNGPTHLLCLSGFSGRALVIDGRSGSVDYNGPTDLQSNFGVLSVRQFGIYAVATEQNQGVFGIGPRAETTWFVPGNGSLRGGDRRPSAQSVQTLTAQLEANPRTYISTVFSVADGRVVEPAIDEGYTLGKTAFYPGGFSAEIDDPEGRSAGIGFFDASGNLLGTYDGIAALPDRSFDLPVISPALVDEKIVYSAEGQKLLVTRDGALALVGTTLMVNMTSSQEFPEWQQYNMRDGSAGPVCNFPMDDYVGHHDSTLVFEFSYVRGEVLLAARDLNSCERLWTIPKGPDSLDRIWRVDGTLVQLTNEGTELRSLVSPN
ncbi:hypothetical protein FIV07_04100 [Mycobacterium sp. THAF192]|nr:hypothetical protein FIV07_04100 [Mycobacterium sp. THAF192]